MTTAEFADYLRRLNAADFDGLGQYLAEDAVLELRSGRAEGRAAAIDLLRKIAARVHGALKADMVLADHDALFADLAIDLRCVEDAPDFSIVPMKAGGHARGRIFALHRFGDDGKIVAIKTAQYGGIEGPIPG